MLRNVRRSTTAVCGLVAAGLAAGLLTPPPAGAMTSVFASLYGVPAGVVLRGSGSFTVSKAGTVVDGLDVAGGITVTAPDVVIKRSRFTGNGGFAAIRTTGSGSVHIQDVTIRGDYSEAGITYANWTASRVEIVGMSNDGAKVGDNVQLRNSWIHDFVPGSGAHGDGLQVQEDVGNVVIQGNRIDIGTRSGVNAAVFLSPDLGPDRRPGPILVDRNTLGGGGFTMYVVGGNGGARLDDVTVTNNTFLRNARYGAIYPGSDCTVQSGNSYAGDRSSISLR